MRRIAALNAYFHSGFSAACQSIMRAPWLFLGHIVACGAHFATAAVVAGLLWFTGYLEWPADVGSTNFDPTVFPVSYEYGRWFTYRPAWIVVYFSLVTSGFHAAIIAFWNFYTDTAIGVDESVVAARDRQIHVHYFSWIEYSISASMMMVCLLSMTGVREFSYLFCGAGALWAVNILGLVGELALFGSIRHNRTWKVWRWPKAVIAGAIASFASWGLVAAVWVGMFVHFFGALIKQGSPPLFLWFLVLGLFFQFTSFGFVYMNQNFNPRKPESVGRNTFYAFSYVLLSLTSKQNLAWSIVFGLATRSV